MGEKRVVRVHCTTLLHLFYISVHARYSYRKYIYLYGVTIEGVDADSNLYCGTVVWEVAFLVTLNSNLEQTVPRSKMSYENTCDANAYHFAYKSIKSVYTLCMRWSKTAKSSFLICIGATGVPIGSTRISRKAMLATLFSPVHPKSFWEGNSHGAVLLLLLLSLLSHSCCLLLTFGSS